MTMDRRQALRSSLLAVGGACLAGCDALMPSHPPGTTPPVKPLGRHVSELEDTVFLGDLELRPQAAVIASEDLAARFPGEAKEWHRGRGDPILGPPQLVRRRAALQKHHQDLSPFEPRKTLCFVFGVGEDTTDRATTRMGGLPYWPKATPWPATKGTPKGFIAQIDFRDVIWPEPLPGDVLTIHDDLQSDEHHGKREGLGLTLTWHSTGKQEPLLEAGAVPQNPDACGPFYSLSVMETDYKFSRRWDVEKPAGFRNYTLHATKIGGHTPFFDANWKSHLADVRDPVFLCSLGPMWKLGPQGWLPTKPGYDAEKVSDVTFLDVATVTICYPKGSPDDLRWDFYMP